MDCPVCKTKIVQGAYLAQGCRMFAALELVAATPGLTTWELSKANEDTTYADLSTGLAKARENKLVITREEPRGGTLTGVRYRYWPVELERMEEERIGHRSSMASHERRKGEVSMYDMLGK